MHAYIIFIPSVDYMTPQNWPYFKNNPWKLKVLIAARVVHILWTTNLWSSGIEIDTAYLVPKYHFYHKQSVTISTTKQWSDRTDKINGHWNEGDVSKLSAIYNGEKSHFKRLKGNQLNINPTFFISPKIQDLSFT